MGGQIIGQVDEWTDNRTSRWMDWFYSTSAQQCYIAPKVPERVMYNTF